MHAAEKLINDALVAALHVVIQVEMVAAGLGFRDGQRRRARVVVGSQDAVLVCVV
jgi:hypothetical protein